MYGLIALNFIIPFVMVFVGYILKKHPVKDMTSGMTYLLNCTGIRMQLYQNLKTTIPRCQHNYTIKKHADNRTLNSYCQLLLSACIIL